MDLLARVELRGDAKDLEALSAVLRDGKHRVIHAEDGLHWLLSTEFDGLIGDPAAVRKKALELLPLINGVARVDIPGFVPVELGVCVDWVRPDGRLRRRLTDTLRLTVRRSGPRVATIEQSDLVASEIERAMSIARRDARFGEVLGLWGSEPINWDTLSKLVEKIQAAVGSVVQQGWATEDELSLFGRTANSPATLGFAARHGVQRGDPPSIPMTLMEATALVERLIRSWLRSLPL